MEEKRTTQIFSARPLYSQCSSHKVFRLPDEYVVVKMVQIKQQSRMKVYFVLIQVYGTIVPYQAPSLSHLDDRSSTYCLVGIGVVVVDEVAAL